MPEWGTDRGVQRPGPDRGDSPRTTWGDWDPPHTPDGQPDIQGVWTNVDPTPFEAPSEVDIERLAALARWFPGTNFNDRGAIATNTATRGARGLPRSEVLQVVEGFTFADRDTIDDEVTITDPAIYTAPWKVDMPLNRDATYDLYEYACHEGNYGLENSLSAGRAEDRAAQGDAR